MRPSWVTDCVSRVVRSPMKASSRSLASPKSSTLSRPSGVEHHVLGLQVAVQDPLRCAAATASVSPIASDRKALGREAARGDRLAERLALDVLHRQEAHPVGFLDRVQHHDAGMAERSHRARLALEALELLALRGRLRRQHLERDAASEPRILGEVDAPHAARAERLEHAVGAERAADERRVRLHLGHVGHYDAASRVVGSRRDNCSHARARTVQPPERDARAARKRPVFERDEHARETLDGGFRPDTESGKIHIRR
jgi:hypothetical protein